MNKCLNCGKDVKNKYCNVSCQNIHQNSSKSDKRFGEYKKFNVICSKCQKEFEVTEREKLHPQKEKYYCSRSCANSHIRTEESKLKTSNTLKNKSIIKIKIDMKCQFCENNFKNKNSLVSHEIRCKLNPNKIRTTHSEETKKKMSGIMKIKNTNSTRIWKQETLDLMSKKSKEINKKIWTKEYREQHSILMNKIIKENPDSYSKNNVSGRAKIYEYKGSKLKGTWELLVATKLDENNIKWTNDITPITYFWNGKNHLYFPDFYLEEYNIFIEVKGYETERDRYKWESVKIPLIILREAEIKSIKDNSKNIIEFIK